MDHKYNRCERLIILILKDKFSYYIKVITY
jgi:hypothetical protein